MRALVYNTETGEIARRMRGNVPLENQRLGGDEAVLVDGADVDPDRASCHAVDLPPLDELDGMMVDPDTREVVDDPVHDLGRTLEDVLADLEAGDITAREALLELYGR